MINISFFADENNFIEQKRVRVIALFVSFLAYAAEPTVAIATTIVAVSVVVTSPSARASAS
jgi:hypothetical protein